MPKKKTIKAISKRVRRTKNGKKSGKIILRTAGQDHFNAKESGRTTRKKRKDHGTTLANEKTINSLT